FFQAEDGIRCKLVTGVQTCALPIFASPYARQNAVDSTFYTTASVLRTIEGILGLPPLSQYDAGATPLWNAFTRRPDSTAFVHLQIGRASCRERVWVWAAASSLQTSS